MFIWRLRLFSQFSASSAYLKIELFWSEWQSNFFLVSCVLVSWTKRSYVVELSSRTPILKRDICFVSHKSMHFLEFPISCALFQILHSISDMIIDLVLLLTLYWIVGMFYRCCCSLHDTAECVYPITPFIPYVRFFLYPALCWYGDEKW